VKEILFDKYSSNFEEILKLFPNLKRSGKRIYMCPLCRGIFNEDNLDPKSLNPLTLEHVPPQSVGGKELVLTCKRCNNEHGSDFDSQLIKKLDHKKLGMLKSGSTNRNVKFKIGDEISSNGNVWIDDTGGINFLLDAKRTNPKYHEELIDIATGKKGSVNMNFSMPVYNENRARISVLRAAYLTTFKELGYAFIFSSNSEIPRKLIMEYTPNSKPFKGLFSMKGSEKFLGLTLINKPERLQGYLVGLKIVSDDIEESYGVLIPGGNQKGKEIYEEFEKLKSEKIKHETISFQLTFLEEEDILNGENSLFALKYWSEHLIAHKGLSK